MKKFLIILCSIFILGSSGVLYADTMPDLYTGTIVPINPGFTFTDFNSFIRYFTPGSSVLGSFDNISLPGQITSANILGSIKGDLFGAIFLWWSPIEIWLGNIEVFDSKDWLTTNQLFSMWTYDTWINGWSKPWSFDIPSSEWDALKEDLSDGVDFIVKGTPFFYSRIQFGLTTISIEDPVEQPLPNNAVPEPATMLLLGSGLIGLAGYGRKKFFKK